MNHRIRDFVNDRYMSLDLLDLIVSIIGFFIYGLIMIFAVQFFIFDVEKTGFELFSLTASYVRHIVITSFTGSAVASIITIILYLQKTKWSVLAIKGVAFSYVTLSLFVLSFCYFNSTIIDIISAVIKILAIPVVIILYRNYLLKMIPNFNPKQNGYESGKKYIALAPMLVVLVRPLLQLILADSGFNIDPFSLMSNLLYIAAIALVTSVTEQFAKVYYAKKLNIN